MPSHTSSHFLFWLNFQLLLICHVGTATAALVLAVLRRVQYRRVGAWVVVWAWPSGVLTAAEGVNTPVHLSRLTA